MADNRKESKENQTRWIFRDSVLSLKRGMFMLRRDGVILSFFLAFSCILISSAAFNSKRLSEADHKRKIGTSCMFHVNILSDLKSRTCLV